MLFRKEDYLNEIAKTKAKQKAFFSNNVDIEAQGANFKYLCTLCSLKKPLKNHIPFAIFC